MSGLIKGSLQIFTRVFRQKPFNNQPRRERLLIKKLHPSSPATKPFLQLSLLGSEFSSRSSFNNREFYQLHIASFFNQKFTTKLLEPRVTDSSALAWLHSTASQNIADLANSLQAYKNSRLQVASFKFYRHHLLKTWQTPSSFTRREAFSSSIA